MKADKLLRACLIENPKLTGEFWIVGLCAEAKLFNHLNPELITSLCQSRKVLLLKEDSQFQNFTLAARIELLVNTFEKKLLRGEKVQGRLSSIPQILEMPTLNVISVPEDQEDLKFARSILEFPIAGSWMMPDKKREKMLLHVCCGPDAAGVIDQLQNEFDLLCFWYDPNIQPKTEHDKRLEAFIKVCELKSSPYIIGDYEADFFLDQIAGLEHTPEQGAKCSVCYDIRLAKAAKEAKTLGCDLYASTLAISPHKVQEKLVKLGMLNEKKWGIPYYSRNFMKSDGFKESVAFTVENQIYRQDYCGCWFSLHEGGPAARDLAKALALEEPKANHFQGGNRPSLDIPLNHYWQQLEWNQKDQQQKYLSARKG